MEVSYKCRSVSKTGEILDDIIKASSQEEAISILKSRNLMPIEVSENVESNFKIKMTKKVKKTDIAVFCRQLAVMLNTGMPINKALDIQQGQSENVTLKNILIEISDGIKKGESLSRSMKQYSGVFPKILLTMVEVGEATGKLDEVLDRMAQHFANENKINNKVKGAMMYPTILIVVTIAVVAGMMLMVVPQFVEIFESSDMELPTITKIVIAMSDSIKYFWYVHLLIMGGTFFGIKTFISTEDGNRTFSEIMSKAPVLGKSTKQIYTARFTRTLSTMLESGVTILDALSMSADTTGNILVKEGVAIAKEGIKSGHTFANELRKIDLFPNMMVSMVSIGEETGSLEMLMRKTADYYDEELEAGIERLLSVIEPILIVFIGAVIGVVVIAIMLPMMEISSGGSI